MSSSESRPNSSWRQRYSSGPLYRSSVFSGYQTQTSVDEEFPKSLQRSPTNLLPPPTPTRPVPSYGRPQDEPNWPLTDTVPFTEGDTNAEISHPTQERENGKTTDLVLRATTDNNAYTQTGAGLSTSHSASFSQIVLPVRPSVRSPGVRADIERQRSSPRNAINSIENIALANPDPPARTIVSPADNSGVSLTSSHPIRPLNSQQNRDTRSLSRDSAVVLIEGVYVCWDSYDHPHFSMPIDKDLRSQLEQEIDHCFNLRRGSHQDRSYVLQMTYAGSTRDNLRPAVVIIAYNTKTRKTLKRSLNQTHVKKILKGLGRDLWILIDRHNLAADPRNACVIRDPVIRLFVPPGHKSLCGSNIHIIDRGKHMSSCVFGGSIMIGDLLVGLTACHPLTEHDREGETSNLEETSDCDDTSDEDDGPFFLSHDMSDRNDLDKTENALTVLSSALESTQSLVKWGVNDPATGRSLKSSKNEQSLHLTFEEYSPLYKGTDADWLAFNVCDSRDLRVPDGVLYNQVGHNYVTSIHKHIPGQVLAVQIALPDGVVDGQLISGPVFCRIGDRTFHLRLVTVNQPMSRGCSGAWVVHRSELVGVVLVIRETIPWVYILPFEVIQDDIQGITNMDVSLPNPNAFLGQQLPLHPLNIEAGNFADKEYSGTSQQKSLGIVESPESRFGRPTKTKPSKKSSAPVQNVLNNSITESKTSRRLKPEMSFYSKSPRASMRPTFRTKVQHITRKIKFKPSEATKSRAPRLREGKFDLEKTKLRNSNTQDKARNRNKIAKQTISRPIPIFHNNEQRRKSNIHRTTDEIFDPGDTYKMAVKTTDWLSSPPPYQRGKFELVSPGAKVPSFPLASTVKTNASLSLRNDEMMEAFIEQNRRRLKELNAQERKLKHTLKKVRKEINELSNNTPTRLLVQEPKRKSDSMGKSTKSIKLALIDLPDSACDVDYDVKSDVKHDLEFNFKLDLKPQLKPSADFNSKSRLKPKAKHEVGSDVKHHPKEKDLLSHELYPKPLNVTKHAMDLPIPIRHSSLRP